MAKFIFLYKGDVTPQEEMTAEAGAEVMGKWNTWMEKVGSGVIDIGAPMDADGVSVIDDGGTGLVEPLNGYTIVEAANMAAARDLTEDHPFLSDKTGAFSIEIYALQDMPEM